MPSDPLSLASIVDLAQELIRIPSVNPTLTRRHRRIAGIGD